MYNKQIENKSELIEVLDALDRLGKRYTVTKTIETIRVDVHDYQRNVWSVQEVE